MQAAGRRRRLRGIALEPLVHHVVIKLLGPQQSRERLPLHAAAVFGKSCGREGIKLVGFADALGEQSVEIVNQARRFGPLGEAHADDFGLAGREIESIPGAGFGAAALGIHGVFAAAHHTLVKRVLGKQRIAAVPQRACVRVVFGEQKFRLAVTSEPVRSERRMLDVHAAFGPIEQRTLARRPRPRVAEPYGRQHVQRGPLRPAIRDGDANQNVVGVRLRIFEENVEVAVLVEYAGIDQLEFRIAAGTTPIHVEQLGVGERALRIFVQRFHVGVRGRGVQVVIQLLHVFTVIALVVGQSEQSLFEDRIVAVPERRCET